MTLDLFEADLRDVPLAPGAAVLGGFARLFEGPLVAALQRVVEVAPFRHMVTPGGRRMSVAMTNCGAVGWVSDRSGYRYDACDPDSGRPWPPIPEVFGELAMQAAKRAGFGGFAPDACLINRYEPGARLSLHQDKDEQDFEAPIVSVSLGLSAVFLFGGMRRADTPRRLPLTHGDVVVWGGPSRLRYHGVLPLEDGHHPLMGGYRINLTFSQGVVTMGRRQLLKRLDKAWRAFKESYAGLSEVQLMEPGVTGAWSVRDIIAHVTTWEEEALKHLPSVLEGHRPPRYSATYGGIDAFNALMTTKKEGLSLSEVFRQQEEIHRRVIDVIERAPEDQLIRETRFRRRLRLDTYSHYPKHTAAIRRWREQRQASGTNAQIVGVRSK